jgi:hypothetical protein
MPQNTLARGNFLAFLTPANNEGCSEDNKKEDGSDPARHRAPQV